MTIEDLENRNYAYVPISVKERLPELMKFVPTIDIDGEIIIYRRTENGWNMRDSRGINTPPDNKEIICWLEKVQLFDDEKRDSLINILSNSLPAKAGENK